MHLKRVSALLASSAPMHSKRVSGYLRIVAFASLVTGLIFCQTQNPEELASLSAKAHDAKDYATFLKLEKQLLTLSPSSPTAIYNVACGEALLGHPAEAFVQLDKLLALHFDLGAETDPDFIKIKSTPGWSEFLSRMAVMRQPLIKSTIAFTLPEKGLLASDIAVDAALGNFYIASARERKIVKHAKDGTVTDFATEKDGLFAVSSLLFDPVRNQLFAGTTAVPFMQNYSKEDEGKAAVFVFNLATGKVVRSATLAVSNERHGVGHMVEDEYGTVYFIDQASSEIRRLRRSSTELELYMSSVVFQHPRGLAFSKDKRTLYVMDLSGLWAVEVLSTERKQIAVAGDVFLGGLLGLTRTDDGFLSVQNGFKLNHLALIRFDPKAEQVSALNILEENHTAYENPERGTIAGGNYYYIANSQLSLIDPKNQVFPMDKANPTVILAFPITK